MLYIVKNIILRMLILFKLFLKNLKFLFIIFFSLYSLMFVKIFLLIQKALKCNIKCLKVVIKTKLDI